MLAGSTASVRREDVIKGYTIAVRTSSVAALVNLSALFFQQPFCMTTLSLYALGYSHIWIVAFGLQILLYLAGKGLLASNTVRRLNLGLALSSLVTLFLIVSNCISSGFSSFVWPSSSFFIPFLPAASFFVSAITLAMAGIQGWLASLAPGSDPILELVLGSIYNLRDLLFPRSLEGCGLRALALLLSCQAALMLLRPENLVQWSGLYVLNIPGTALLVQVGGSAALLHAVAAFTLTAPEHYYRRGGLSFTRLRGALALSILLQVGLYVAMVVPVWRTWQHFGAIQSLSLSSLFSAWSSLVAPERAALLLAAGGAVVSGALWARAGRVQFRGGEKRFLNGIACYQRGDLKEASRALSAANFAWAEEAQLTPYRKLALRGVRNKIALAASRIETDDNAPAPPPPPLPSSDTPAKLALIKEAEKAMARVEAALQQNQHAELVVAWDEAMEAYKAADLFSSPPSPSPSPVETLVKYKQLLIRRFFLGLQRPSEQERDFFQELDEVAARSIAKMQNSKMNDEQRASESKRRSLRNRGGH